MMLHYVMSLESATLIERFVTSWRGTSEGLFRRRSRSIAFGNESVGHGEGCKREAKAVKKKINIIEHAAIPISVL